MSALIHYRPFLNCDSPSLVRVWKEQASSLGLVQPMNSTLLEMFVLAKPYFDRAGLMLVTEDGEVMGFAHFGFGPNAAGDGLSHEDGVISMLLVRPHPRRGEFMTGLLEQCEAGLRRAGARRIRIGAPYPQSPFYLGLCGGSDLPGVPTADTELERFYREHGYQETGRTVVYQLDLTQMRTPIDRVQIQNRRGYRVLDQVNPRGLTWWDACVFGPTDCIRFQLEAKAGGPPCGQVIYWDMGPVSTRPRSGGMGMIHTEIDPTHCQRGLGTLLLVESLKNLSARGATRIESQTMATNVAGQKLLAKVGFRPVSEGILFEKTLA